MSQFTFAVANAVSAAESLPQPLAAFSPELQVRMQHAITAMPPAHLSRQALGETVLTRDEAYKRLQNWAFIKGFAISFLNSSSDRVRFQCVHHGADTKNTR